MKYIKLFESYKKKIIPIDIIVWCLQHYYTNNNTEIDLPIIPSGIFNESTKYLKEEFNVEYLYRGISVSLSEYNKIRERGFILTNSIESWTFDQETAREFLGGDEVNLLIKLPIDKFDKLLSMDYIIDFTTLGQKKELFNYKYLKWNCGGIYDYYASESECISFGVRQISTDNLIVI